MVKSKKKTTLKFITKMLISSREWELFGDPQSDGASFCFDESKNRGRRTLVIGTKSNDPRYHAEMLIHEIIEIILDSDKKRLESPHIQKDDCTRFVFVFDHDYLDGIGANLLTALLTSGMFELKEEKCKG
jgi:hypothetical protein